MKIKDELLDLEGIKNSKKSLLELFIRRTAVLTSTHESLVEKIIKDQWEVANINTRPESTITEINFPNLGTFYLSKTKSLKKYNRILKEELDININSGRKDRYKDIKESIILKNKDFKNEDEY